MFSKSVTLFEENHRMDSFTVKPTKGRGKVRRERIQSLAVLTRQEQKSKKKAEIAHSEYWKLKHQKEHRRFREKKYADPIDDPLDFSAEEFSNELSGKYNRKVTLEHYYQGWGDDPCHQTRLQATLYTSQPIDVSITKSKGDDIFIITAVHDGHSLVPYREIHRGNWRLGLPFEIIDTFNYGSGQYVLDYA